MTDQEKRPMPGEWWETREGRRRYIVALVPLDICDDPLFTVDWHGNADNYRANGRWLNTSKSECDLTRHLPGCTGWDWEEKDND